MKAKRGIKLLFAMLAVVGGAVALSACGSWAKEAGPSVVEPDTPDTSETPDTTDTPDTPDNPDEEDRIARVNVQIKLESYLQDKLNDRFEENVVSNVEAHNFTLKDSVETGKTLETSGYVTLADGEEAKPVTFGLPVSLEQYTNLYDLGFNAECDATKQLSENYTLEQLNFADTIISNENLTYNYATLNGNVWDLDAATPTKIEKKLEAYFEQKIQNWFLENTNDKYFENVDLKYFTTKHDFNYGDVVRIHGNLKAIINNNTYPLIITLRTSQTNYTTAKSIADNLTIDENKDMAKNYDIDIMNFVNSVVEDENTTIKLYSINGTSYNADNNMNL